MLKLMRKYEDKLIRAGLSGPGGILLGGPAAAPKFTRDDPAAEVLSGVIQKLKVDTILYAQPAEPYRTILDFMAGRGETVRPSDCETRFFLQDLPVVDRFEADSIAAALSQRKAVILPGGSMITCGTDNPEFAFVFYSCALFACFVKFFADHLEHCRQGVVTPGEEDTFRRVAALLDPVRSDLPELMRGPFTEREPVLAALAQAGKATVSYRLVDSFFGNVSYLLDGLLYISQTSSSLDELPGYIVACPTDGSSCEGLKASSELPAHQAVVKLTGHKAVLHGHPKFAVILSLDCQEPDCDQRGRGSCHLACPRQREVCGAPIVPGEVGSGPYGLCNTVPRAMPGRRGVIVYGHGLFTSAPDDFNVAFANLLSLENACREEYFRRLGELG